MRCKRCFVCFSQSKLCLANPVHVAGQVEHLVGETPLAEAIEVIRRLQRELTKAYFMANKERMVLTFSAGVTSCLAGEEEVDIIDRADRAMYHAKINGKNRAVSAEELENDPSEDLSF